VEQNNEATDEEGDQYGKRKESLPKKPKKPCRRRSLPGQKKQGPIREGLRTGSSEITFQKKERAEQEKGKKKVVMA